MRVERVGRGRRGWGEREAWGGSDGEGGGVTCAGSESPVTSLSPCGRSATQEGCRLDVETALMYVSPIWMTEPCSAIWKSESADSASSSWALTAAAKAQTAKRESLIACRRGRRF